MASIINATTSTGLVSSADNSGSLQLATNNGTTAVTIDTSQNVGIGTTSPAVKCHVSSSAGVALRIDNPSSTSTGVQSFLNGNLTSAVDFSTSGTIFYQNAGSGACPERMRITSSGNLEMASSAGIVQTATNQTIRMPSTGGIGYVGNINSASVFQIAYNSTSAGVQLSSGATSWGTFSDSRLKNITGTYTNALNDIAQIQPVKFTWKADEDNKPQVGVIAQSVQNVVPEAIESSTIEMEGTEEYLTVRYTELIPLMIASIQELNTDLANTKLLLTEVSNKVEAQAVRIAELEGAK
jgi:hypothetical protein